MPNAALLGAFAALTVQTGIQFIQRAIRERFPGRIGEADTAAELAAYELVTTKETVHA